MNTIQLINIYIHSNIKAPVRHSDGAYIYVVEYYADRNGESIVSLPTPRTIYASVNVHALTAREAEVEALISALGRITKPCELTVYAENVNMVSALQNGWYRTWHDSGWIKADGKEPVRDSERWQRLYDGLSMHTLCKSTCETHSYTSWMHSQIEGHKPDTKKSVEMLIKSIQRAEQDIRRYTEPLEKSDILQNAEVNKMLSVLINTAFENLPETEMQQKSGFVKIENSESQIKSIAGGELDMEKCSNLLTITGNNKPQNSLALEEMGVSNE